MLEAVYEGSKGRIKCEKCDCWLGFKPANHLITAPCPTCENPLVVPPRVLSFPDVEKALSIDLKPKRRTATALPSIPERTITMKPARKGAVRLDASVTVSEVQMLSFLTSQVFQRGQVSLPATRQPANTVEDLKIGNSVQVADRKGPLFMARLQSTPNNGQNNGFKRSCNSGFVSSLQRMSGFFSMLAVLMIVGIFTTVLFNKDDQNSTKTMELNLPEQATPAVEHDLPKGLVDAP